MDQYIYGVPKDDWNNMSQSERDEALRAWNAEETIGSVKKPGDIKYTPSYDPNTMGMEQQVQQHLQDQQGFNKFSQEAMRNGPSPWARMAHSNQDLESLNQQDIMRKSAAGQVGQAETALAMRGGSTSGARERLQEQGAQQSLDMNQNIRRQGALNGMQIDMNDEQNRIQQLSQLPGMEMSRDNARSGARQFDIGNRINEQNQHNAFDMNIYDKKMGAYGADRTAKAEYEAGKH